MQLHGFIITPKIAQLGVHACAKRLLESFDECIVHSAASSAHSPMAFVCAQLLPPRGCSFNMRKLE